MAKRKSKKKTAGFSRKIIVIILFFATAGLLMYLFLPDVITEKPISEVSRTDIPKDSDVEIKPLTDVLPAGFEVLIYAEDMNRDGNLNALAYKPLNLESSRRRYLERQDYNIFFSEMKVYSVSEDGWVVILEVSVQGIKTGAGKHIIQQVEDAHGYALQISEYSKSPYTGPVQIFDIVILNEQDRPASDNLTLYWHPEEQVYKATNTFGAEDTFR